MQRLYYKYNITIWNSWKGLKIVIVFFYSLILAGQYVDFGKCAVLLRGETFTWE